MNRLKSLISNFIQGMKASKKKTAIAISGIAAVCVVSTGAIIYSQAADGTEVPFQYAYSEVISGAAGYDVLVADGSRPLAQSFEVKNGYRMITNEYQLYEVINFAGKTGYNSGKYRLANDIVLTDGLSVSYQLNDASNTSGTFEYKDYAIGTFNGEFDGNGYQITFPGGATDINVSGEKTNVGMLFGELGSGSKVHDLILTVGSPTYNFKTDVQSTTGSSVAASDISAYTPITNPDPSVAISSPIVVIDNDDKTSEAPVPYYFVTNQKDIVKKIDRYASQEKQYKAEYTVTVGGSISSNDYDSLLTKNVLTPYGSMSLDNALNGLNFSDHTFATIADHGSNLTSSEIETTAKTVASMDAKADSDWSAATIPSSDATASIENTTNVSKWWTNLSAAETDNKATPEAYNTNKLSTRGTGITLKGSSLNGTLIESANDSTGTLSSGYYLKHTWTVSANGKTLEVKIYANTQYYKRTDEQRITVYDYVKYNKIKSNGRMTLIKAGTLAGEQVLYNCAVNASTHDVEISNVSKGNAAIIPSEVNFGVVAGKSSDASNVYNISIRNASVISTPSVAGSTAATIIGKDISDLVEKRVDTYYEIGYTKNTYSVEKNVAGTAFEVKEQGTGATVSSFPDASTSANLISGMDAITTSKVFTTGTPSTYVQTDTFEPSLAVGGLFGASGALSLDGIELIHSVYASAASGSSYTGKVSAGGVVGNVTSGSVAINKSIVDSDAIGVSGGTGKAFSGILAGSSDEASTNVSISNTFMAANNALNSNVRMMGSTSVLTMSGVKAINACSYNNNGSSESITALSSADKDDMKVSGSAYLTYKDTYGVRYLDKDGDAHYLVVPNWLCTDLTDTNFEIVEVKAKDTSNPKLDIKLEGWKRRNSINAAIGYNYMTAGGGEESKVVKAAAGVNVDSENQLTDLTIDTGSTSVAGPCKSSYVKIKSATFYDGYQFYVAAPDFEKDYLMSDQEYQYGADEEVYRKSTEPDNDYIRTYISTDPVNPISATSLQFFYSSDDGASYTVATDYEFNEDSTKYYANILFDADTAKYIGFWNVDGYLYPTYNVTPLSDGAAYTYSETNRISVASPIMQATTYSSDKNCSTPQTSLEKVTHDMDTAEIYSFGKDYIMQIKPYAYDSGVGAGTTYPFKYYYLVGTSAFTEADINTIVSTGTELAGGSNISFSTNNPGDILYVGVVRTRQYRKPSLAVYEVHILDDWDHITVAPTSAKVWSDESLTISNAVNLDDLNSSYAYASSANGYDPAFNISGIRYIITTQKKDSCKTLKGITQDASLSESGGNNVVAAGVVNASILNGQTIDLSRIKYIAANEHCYVYVQYYGNGVCGKIHEFEFALPTKASYPELIPSAGTSDATKKDINAGDNAYIVKEDGQAYVYAVDSSALKYDAVTSVSEKNRLEATYPSIGSATPRVVSESSNLYVGCAGRWYKVTGGTAYDEEKGISMSNTTGTAIAKTVSVLTFQNDFLPSDVRVYYYNVEPVKAAETVSFEPNGDSVSRFSKVYLKSLTLNSELYYIVDQNGGSFTTEQINELKSVTYGMNPAALPSAVYKYDSSTGILVTGESKVTISAVAISEKSLISTVATKSYDVTEPDSVAPVTSVPSGTATAAPIVVPGEKILLISATSGAEIYYSLTGNVKLTKNADGSYSIPEDAKNSIFLYNSKDGIVMPDKKSATDTNIVIYAVAVKKGLNASAQAVLSFQYPGEVGIPRANIDSGEVANGTVIKLTSSTEAATIYYTMTTDGSEPADPTIASTTYDKELGITISKPTKIKAIAVKNSVASSVVSYQYTLSEKLAAPTASLTSGSVSTRGTIVKLSAAEGATIYYTTDATSPKDSENTSVMIGDSVILDGKEGDLVTIKAYASLSGKQDSDEATFTYTISSTPGGITADPPSGTELGVGSIVNLISDVSDATIYYTLDGSNPTSGSKSGTSVKLEGEPGTTVTIKAIAIASGGDTKAYALFSYKLKNKPAKATASQAGGELTTAKTITLSSSGGKIYYTTNGEDPTANSNLYTEPIKITKGMTVKAVVISDDGEMSDISEFKFSAAKKMLTPVADIASGVLDPGTVVHLSTDDSDAVIYYSTDGTKPSTNNLEQLLQYTSDGISINRNVSIKAVAFKEGQQLSDALELEYVVNKIPAVEEKQRMQEEAEKNALHDTDTSELEDRREMYDFSGTAYSEVVIPEYDNYTVVSCKYGVVPKNCSLETVKISSNANLNDSVKLIFGDDYTVLNVYDLSIISAGEAVQPDGTVEIGLPIPKELKSAVIYMIYVDDSGNIQKLETRRDGNMAYAKTDHFSCYALVGADLNTNEGFSFRWIYVAFILLGYSVLFVIVYGAVTIYRVETKRKMRKKQRELEDNSTDGE